MYLVYSVSDCHVHSKGVEKAERIVKAMDAANVEKIVLFSPHPGLMTMDTSIISREKFRECVKFASDIQRYDPDRIICFAFIDPRMEGAVYEAERVVCDLELKGFKMIPAGWYPYEERFRLLFEKIESLRAPIIFHSGISWGFPDSSRFCRPVYYEFLMFYPKIRFALAHIGWPWVDECLATAGRFLAAVGWDNIDKTQMFIDITPGTPRLWRSEALRKAIVYLGSDLLIFGSDNGNPEDPERFKKVILSDLAILKEELGLTEDSIEKIMKRNLERFLKGVS
ncbi:amidohydrolase family protein [Candidatus Bathyarchaeota archaeon]|nr:amidohydrolase family protein [Candidatus Bathyarchaeota archaeon]